MIAWKLDPEKLGIENRPKVHNWFNPGSPPYKKKQEVKSNSYIVKYGSMNVINCQYKIMEYMNIKNWP